MAVTWFFIAGSFFLAFVATDFAYTQSERTIQIPEQSDWMDRGVVLSAGPPGSWDARLSGMISPSAVVKKDGIYYLYYIGADGDRRLPHTDGGPRHRALGVATSTDGIKFIKYSMNPILTFLPNNNDEEGIFSAGATLNGNGDVVLYYSACDAGNSASTAVACDGYLAISSNGLEFQDLVQVLSHDDPSVWGSGTSGRTDELFPVGTFTANGDWYVYYITKGFGHWDLGLAWGSRPDGLTNTKGVLKPSRYIVLSRSYIRGGGDPVSLGPDKIGIFILRDFGKGIVEVRTASKHSPDRLSNPVEIYNFDDFSHFTILLNRETDTWFMYYRNKEAADAIRLKTAPVSRSGTTLLDLPTDSKVK